MKLKYNTAWEQHKYWRRAETTADLSPRRNKTSTTGSDFLFKPVRVCVCVFYGCVFLWPVFPNWWFCATSQDFRGPSQTAAGPWKHEDKRTDDIIWVTWSHRKQHACHFWHCKNRLFCFWTKWRITMEGAEHLSWGAIQMLLMLRTSNKCFVISSVCSSDHFGFYQLY